MQQDVPGLSSPLDRSDWRKLLPFEAAAAALRAADQSPAGAGQAEAGANRAMAWLERAVAAGYREPAIMAEDRDFDSLRHRADFKGLVARLSAAHPK